MTMSSPNSTTVEFLPTSPTPPRGLMRTREVVAMCPQDCRHGDVAWRAVMIGQMRCPVCRSPDTRVLDKRDSADASPPRRRRQCGACLHRFTTYERPDTAALMVVKSDHRRQEWNPDKLRRSLQVACTKRPIRADTIERTGQQIELVL